MLNIRHVLVVDLDNTLISTNSFTLWIRFLFRKSILTLRFRVLLKLFAALILRKIVRVTDHATFKSRVDKLEIPKEWVYEFIGLLQSYSYSNVVNTIAEYQPSMLILATAAPSIYASKLIEFCGLKFDEILCSRWRTDGFHDNQRERKRDYLFSYLENKLMTDYGIVLFTDHADDLPIAKIATKNYLCNPTESSLALFNRSGVAYEVIKN